MARELVELAGFGEVLEDQEVKGWILALDDGPTSARATAPQCAPSGRARDRKLRTEADVEDVFGQLREGQLAQIQAGIRVHLT